jgi:alpha-maltose-1-phosphate synthase
MRVLHVAPTAFGQDGLFGGGGRYPLELARAPALVDGVRCELVTVGREAHRHSRIGTGR